MTRSFAECDAGGQGRAIAALPPFTIEKIGEAPPQPLAGGQRPLSAGERPLSGVRVLDLTRVIAGPVEVIQHSRGKTVFVRMAL